VLSRETPASGSRLSSSEPNPMSLIRIKELTEPGRIYQRRQRRSLETKLERFVFRLSLLFPGHSKIAQSLAVCITTSRVNKTHSKEKEEVQKKYIIKKRNTNS